MSALDRLTDDKCRAVARVMQTIWKAADSAGFQPASLMPTEDLEAVLEFVTESGGAEPVDVDDEENQT